MNLRFVWLGLAAFLLALVTVLPVRWIAGMLPPQLKCAVWSGSVWSGQCTGLTVQQGGPALDVEVLRWKLHPASLLHFTLKADFSARTSMGTGSGVAEFSRDGSMAVEDLSLSAVLDHRLATMLAQGWKGQLGASHFAFRMQGNTLQALSGEITLRDFTDGHGAQFGSYKLTFPAAAAPPFNGRLTDIGGPLAVNATVTIAADRRWQLDSQITPRPDAPMELRSRLDVFSAPDASGRHRFQSEGTFK